MFPKSKPEISVDNHRQCLLFALISERRGRGRNSTGPFRGQNNGGFGMFRDWVSKLSPKVPHPASSYSWRGVFWQYVWLRCRYNVCCHRHSLSLGLNLAPQWCLMQRRLGNVRGTGTWHGELQSCLDQTVRALLDFGVVQRV